jgi:hypothetical protein
MTPGLAPSNPRRVLGAKDDLEMTFPSPVTGQVAGQACSKFITFVRRALVNSVMNLRCHKMLGNYRVAAQLVASRVVLSSTELVN